MGGACGGGLAGLGLGYGLSSMPGGGRRIDKVKFGVPLADVCKNDIPAPLLVFIRIIKTMCYKRLDRLN